MPFKSMAQNRWAHAAARRGDFPAGKLEEWEGKTDYTSLPEKVGQADAAPPVMGKPPKPPGVAKRRGPASGLQRSSWLRAAAKRKWADGFAGRTPKGMKMPGMGM